jgi:hypothetical protein
MTHEQRKTEPRDKETAEASEGDGGEGKRAAVV